MFDLTLLSILETIIKLSMIIMIGLYFTFSNTVMRVLTNFENGSDVMVAINREILNPLFLGCFFISGVGSLSLSLMTTGLLASASIVFFIGTVAVTIVFNVPLNNKLKESSEQQRNEVWREYLYKWVIWNHVRTIFGVISGLLLSL